MAKRVVLAIDPGRSKVGIAAVQEDGQVLYRGVLRVEELPAKLQSLKQRFPLQQIVMGGGTGYPHIEKTVCQVLEEVSIQVVDEAYTSQEARRRYLQENPPKGWRKLLPRWLRTPEQPYDDYVAVMLAERYWQQQREGDGA